MTTFLQVLGYVIGSIGTISVIVSIALYSKTAGNIAALEKTRDTWRELYEAEREKTERQREENAELKATIKDFSERIARLEAERQSTKEADDAWVGRIILATINGGVCEKSDCSERIVPDRRSHG